MNQAPDLVSAGADADIPTGFTKSEAGLLIPDNAQPFEIERWPFAKVQQLQRAATFALTHQLSLALACEDARCKHDPVLRRVDIPDKPHAFVLACHHKLRVCVDEDARKRAVRAAFRSAHHARGAAQKHRDHNRKRRR